MMVPFDLWEVPVVVVFTCGLKSAAGLGGAIRFSAGGLAFGSKEGNLGFKILKSVKGSIDGSEPKVGNLVEFTKWSKDCESHFLGRDFAISCGAKKILDALCK
jgi:hypothetical protein